MYFNRNTFTYKFNILLLIFLIFNIWFLTYSCQLVIFNLNFDFIFAILISKIYNSNLNSIFNIYLLFHFYNIWN